MKIAVLVITPAEGFGELIRQTLEETGRFQVAVIGQQEAVSDALTRHHPQIIVLDGDIDPAHAEEMLRALKQQAPGAKVAFIPPEGPPGGEAQPSEADALLDKPFYLPELLEVMDRLAGAAEGEPEAPSRLPAWLADPDQAARHLARLTLGSLAVASALVTRDGQLYAYAGQLPRLAANEVAQTVAYYWEAGGQADFARYLTLDAVQGEFMAYVTQVTRDVALAMLFESQTPFTRIREQAARLAQALSEIPAETPAADEGPSSTASQEAAPLPAEPEPQAGLTEDEEDLPPEAFKPLFEDVPPPIPEDWAPGGELTPEQRAVLDALLRAEDESLTEAPSAPEGGPAAPQGKEAEALPTPEAPPPAASGAEEAMGALPEAEPSLERAFPPSEGEIDEAPTPPREAAFSAADVEAVPDPSEAPTVAVSLDDASPAPSPADEAPTRPAEVASPPEPSVAAEATEGALPPPATLARANLQYACVLVPRMPQHYLTGDLARRLNQWVRRICTAFGWRLTHLAVRPNYLHWVVQVLPNTSPAYAVRVIREHTSTRIFRFFPYLAHDNPSGDFWAPGYLVIAQPRPLEPNIILEFLWEVRRRQGLEE